jgi:hypothetical protein
MANPRLPALVLAVVTASLTACSLFLNFNEEGQKCDQNLFCLEGYVCQEGLCKKRTGDAGCTCDEGFACDTQDECQPTSCETKRCPPGVLCRENGTNPQCIDPINAPALNGLCRLDVECDAGTGNRFCLYSAGLLEAERASPGASRLGVCVERCSPAVAGSCSTATAACTTPTGPVSGGASVCVTASMWTACDDQGDCAPHKLECTLFDNANVGPRTVCERPVSTGLDAGEACSASDGGTLPCRSGLCVSPDGGAGRLCSNPCSDDSGCAADQKCTGVSVALTVPAAATPPGPRSVGVCVPR